MAFFRFPIVEIRGGGDAAGGLERVRGGLDVLDPANHFHPIAEQTPWYAIKEKYSKVDDLRTGLLRKRGPPGMANVERKNTESWDGGEFSASF